MGGWPNAVINMMAATEMDEKYTRGYIAYGTARCGKQITFTTGAHFFANALAMSNKEGKPERSCQDIASAAAQKSDPQKLFERS